MPEPRRMPRRTWTDDSGDINSANSTSTLFLGHGKRTKSWMSARSGDSPSCPQQPSKFKKPASLRKLDVHSTRTSISGGRVNITRGDWSSSTDDEVNVSISKLGTEGSSPARHMVNGTLQTANSIEEVGPVVYRDMDPSHADSAPVPNFPSNTPQRSASMLVTSAASIHDHDLDGTAASPQPPLSRPQDPLKSPIATGSMIMAERGHDDHPSESTTQVSSSTLMTVSQSTEQPQQMDSTDTIHLLGSAAPQTEPLESNVAAADESAQQHNAAPQSSPCILMTLMEPKTGHGLRLKQIVDDLGLRDVQTQLDVGRVNFLMEAAEMQDMDVFLLHQLYMIWTLRPREISEALHFGPSSLQGMSTLTYILGANESLTPRLANALLDFPEPWQVVLKPEFFSHVTRMQNTVTLLHQNWQAVLQMCLKRGFPPSPIEVCLHFDLPSPRMQLACFTALCHHLRFFSDNHHQSAVVSCFTTFQQKRPASSVPRDIDFAEWVQALPLPSSASTNTMRRNSAIPDMDPNAQIHPQQVRGALQPPRPASIHPNPRHSQVPTFNNRTPHFPPPQLGNANPSERPSPVLMHQHRNGGFVGSHQVPRPGQRPQAIPPQFQQYQNNAQPLAYCVPRQRQQFVQQPQSQVGTNLDHLSIHPLGWAPTPKHVQGLPGLPQALIAPHMQTQYQPSAPATTLLPPPNWQMPQAVHPRSDRVALHQAHLRSPVARIVDANNKAATDLILYESVKRLILPPQPLGHNNRFAFWSIDISNEEMDRKLVYAPPSHSTLMTGSHLFKQGSLRWRLKCVAREATETSTPDEAEFCSRPVSWPEHLFVSFNQLDDVLLRRKQHYGRDLPADLTSYVQVGANILTLSFDETSKEESEKKVHWIAIEEIELVEDDQLRRSIDKIPPDISLSRTLACMKGNEGDDDDVAITNPTLSIEVADPFTAVIWKTPVRGKTCKHRECFDLDTFLSSRPKSQLAGPAGADDWRCPHCQKDARPQSLIIDGFLENVRETLEQQGLLDVKAIVIKENGQWEAKQQHQDGRAKSAMPSAPANGEGALRPESTVERGHTVSVPPNIASPVDVGMVDDE
ncbi:uncharacterized protein HMPREF1541_07511 [Cyphellophora europaea CBS 101466]|uniref:SP-RING-type domain-containing protein n=1 Tax=Cyphellophora europaea (strain CBS 101466) TaxID=1220924 RepID=W2RQC3_CYPE1|nr:uncharacterized protein HMPREF1541_07511 [Cyphellophora europaea CBS 101466]ETN37888.1 hypothetical protein HMPREF1541_07511 [Cyphellophora europaea CBS 101466]